MDIPLTQKAVILNSPSSPLIFSSNHPVVRPEELQPGECLVRITHSGVCHSDFSLRIGEWPAHIKPKDSLIGGHEGVGVVVAIGQGSQQNVNYIINIGDRVGVKWIALTCGKCNMCVEGSEQCELDFRSFNRLLYLIVRLSIWEENRLHRRWHVSRVCGKHRSNTRD